MWYTEVCNLDVQVSSVVHMYLATVNMQASHSAAAVVIAPFPAAAAAPLLLPLSG